MIKDLTELYCKSDDFCKQKVDNLRVKLIEGGKRTRQRSCTLSNAELLTIVTSFHQSGYRNLKSYYFYLQTYHKKDFPNLVSYSRFIQLMPRVTRLIVEFLLTFLVNPGSINFIDSTSIQVCKIKRERRNKVFKGIATKGKTTVGWFFGFKLHLIINEVGELISIHFTAGNVDDRKPVDLMTKNIFGKIFADKGYIGQELFERLYSRGLKLVTGIKSNMKNKLVLIEEKIFLRKRSVIETVNDMLKNTCQIEHSRHRSPINFLVNLFSGLVAYCLLDKKPSINFSQKQLELIQN